MSVLKYVANKVPKDSTERGGGLIYPLILYWNFRNSAHFFLQLTTKKSTFFRRAEQHTAFTFKIQFSSKNKTRISLHKSTEWLFFWKGMLLAHIFGKCTQMSNILGIKKEESKYETKFKSELLLMKFINMK